MRIKLNIISLSIWLLFACEKHTSFCFIQSNFENQVTDSCAIRYYEDNLNDTIKSVKLDEKKIKFLKINENAIFESVDNNHYYLAYSLIDTVKKNRSIGFFGESFTKLNRVETFNLNGVGYVVYKFLEEADTQESYYSYYTPQIGFFKYYYLHSGSQLTANVDKALQLLEIMKKNKDFMEEMQVKNPVVKLEDYLPPKDSIH